MHTTEIQALKVLRLRRLIDMNFKQHFVHFVTMIIKNGICHETFAHSFRKGETHFVFVKTQKMFVKHLFM